jgi:hypothetical protein
MLDKLQMDNQNIKKQDLIPGEFPTLPAPCICKGILKVLKSSDQTDYTRRFS